jgi:peptidoglycan/LPS O-acetylase OafA/YrhL
MGDLVSDERKKNSHRIAFLDGLRGVAVTAVLLYHAYAAAGAQYKPFGGSYNRLFGFGWMGVQLFFLISGFVILMTLERRPNLRGFAWHRWLRLFPAMAIVTGLTYSWLRFTGPWVGGEVRAIDVAPGLIFVNPALIHAVTRLQIDSLCGAFWSLYVEVVFYVIFGIAYRLGGRWAAIAAITLIAAVAGLAGTLAAAGLGGPRFARVAAGLDWMGFIHFSWFAAGAAAFIYFREGNLASLALAIVVGIGAALTTHALGMNFLIRAELVGILALFLVALCWRPFQALLSTRLLVFLGFISYPLYLVHGRILAVLTYWQWHRFPAMPGVLTPVAPVLISIGSALVIARHGEPALRRLLERSLVPGKTARDPTVAIGRR